MLHNRLNHVVLIVNHIKAVEKFKGYHYQQYLAENCDEIQFRAYINIRAKRSVERQNFFEI